MNNKFIATVVFWGSLWGILEATLGWSLHNFHFPNVGLMMYPFGAYCMLSAMVRTDNAVKAPIMVATVAALLKMINYFMVPSSIFFCVSNASICIILESLAVVLFMKIRNGQWLRDLCIVSSMVFATFLIFRGYQVFNDWNEGITLSYHTFTLSMLYGWIWTAIVQGFFILILTKYINQLQVKVHNICTWEYRLSLPLFIVAVALTMVFNLRVC
jgi:hypothetical protein